MVWPQLYVPASLPSVPVCASWVGTVKVWTVFCCEVLCMHTLLDFTFILFHIYSALYTALYTTCLYTTFTGTNRPLAFASEGAVAGKSLLPRYAYLGAWGLSGLAVGSDIINKTLEAQEGKAYQTAGYYTAFHVPASLVLPAVIIHKIVHASQHAINTRSMFKSLSPRAKALAPGTGAIVECLYILYICI